MMGWGNQGCGLWSMGWFGWILMILFWVVVIVGIVMFIRYLWFIQKRDFSSFDRGDPMEILKNRYAKGEIDTQEFEGRKKTLEGES